MGEEMQISECFAKVCDLAIKLGANNLISHPGAWVHTVDEHWIVALNPHAEPVRVTPDGSMGCDVPFGHVAVWFNGWLAGLFAPDGGSFVLGSAANEDEFIAALDRAIAA